MSRRTLLLGSAAALGQFMFGQGRAWSQSDREVARLVESRRVPGLCMSRIEKGSATKSRAFGVASKATGAPMNPNTIFEAASLSKPVFASAVMRLRDRGKIDLDAPLASYLDESFVPDEPRIRTITARHVLSHQSGLPHGRDEGEPIRLQFEPGTRFMYSSMGLDYLQRVVETLSEKPLAEFMEAEVFGPLAMSDSSFGWRDSFAGVRADAYDDRGDAGITFNEKYRTASDAWRSEVRRLFPELSNPSAAAGMYTTAGDYGRFLSAMLSPDSVPAWLASETIQEMSQPQISVGRGVSWGLGWGLLDTADGPALWHWGNWNGLFQHLAIGVLKTRRGEVILTNSGNGLGLCQKLVPQTLGIDLGPIRGFLS